MPITVVLTTAKCISAEQEILQMHRVPSAVSPDIRQALIAARPEPKPQALQQPLAAAQ